MVSVAAWSQCGQVIVDVRRTVFIEISVCSLLKGETVKGYAFYFDGGFVFKSFLIELIKRCDVVGQIV